MAGSGCGGGNNTDGLGIITVILLDDRTGSKELLPLFPTGSVQLTHLDYADCCFTGNGEGLPYNIGIERKAIRDLINSMVTGRLSGHQLPGLLNSYNVIYLVVEGIYRPGNDGLIEIWGRRSWETLRLGNRTFLYQEVINFLNTICIKTGVHVWQTGTEQETVRLIMSLYHWWEKPYEKHSSHIKSKQVETAYLFKPTFKQIVASELDGIGIEKAKVVCAAFPTVLDMANATVGDWAKLPGVGKTIAEKAVKAFQQ